MLILLSHLTNEETEASETFRNLPKLIQLIIRSKLLSDSKTRLRPKNDLGIVDNDISKVLSNSTNLGNEELL